MKIAICYSGNLRTFSHCVKNHAEIIKEADIYISTWDTIRFSDKDNEVIERSVLPIKFLILVFFVSKKSTPCLVLQFFSRITKSCAI